MSDVNKKTPDAAAQQEHSEVFEHESSPTVSKAEEVESTTKEDTVVEPPVVEEDRAHAAAAQAAASADAPQRDMSTSLPLLFSLAALILAVFAFYMAQQGNDQHDARLQSLTVRVGSIETQTNNLEKRLHERESQTHAQSAAVVRAELDVISASLARIAPLASGENKATITGIQQLLGSTGDAQEQAPVHGTVEAVPLKD